MNAWNAEWHSGRPFQIHWLCEYFHFQLIVETEMIWVKSAQLMCRQSVFHCLFSCSGGYIWYSYPNQAHGRDKKAEWRWEMAFWKNCIMRCIYLCRWYSAFLLYFLAVLITKWKKKHLKEYFKSNWMTGMISRRRFSLVMINFFFIQLCMRSYFYIASLLYHEQVRQLFAAYFLLLHFSILSSGGSVQKKHHLWVKITQNTTNFSESCLSLAIFFRNILTIFANK